jgi:hypothetical protein
MQQRNLSTTGNPMFFNEKQIIKLLYLYRSIISMHYQFISHLAY